MRQEWKTYRSNLVRSGKYGLVAIGISFLFFVVNIPNTPRSQVLKSFWANTAISVFIALLICFMFAIMRLFYTVKEIRTGRPQKFPPGISFAISMMGMSLGLFIGFSVRAKILNEEPDFRYLGSAVLSGAFISLVFILYAIYRDNRLKFQKLKTETVQAQYTALKNQMQPHFLFNSLNSVTELIESDRSNAAKMTQQLSDLYREILENSKQTTASLKSEISIVRKYLELEKVRFGDRLNFEINISEDSREVYLPSLILQTLVENSIKHGISKLVDGGEVLVNVRKEGENLFQVSIENSGETLASNLGSGGTGLENTISRLSLLYGDTHGFNIGINDCHRTEVSFHISGEKLG